MLKTVLSKKRENESINEYIHPAYGSVGFDPLETIISC